MIKILIILFVFSSIFLSCKKKDKKIEPIVDIVNVDEDTYVYQAPSYFPVVSYPNDNKPTKSKFLLGKKLFFDPILSKDFSISCASCHFQNLAFAHNVKFSAGVQGRIGLRNSPTLANIAYSSSLFWDGGVPSLELQALAPLDNHLEMDLPFDSMINRLKSKSEYIELFNKAFAKQPDIDSYTKALACFQRAMISGESKFDKYYYQHSNSQFNASEINGLNLFTSDRLACTKCHSGFNFSNGQFENNGLYLNYPDAGRYNVVAFSQNIGKFKVPTLRNIALTSPYMHDGSLATLEEVVEHYNSGGKSHINQSVHVKPLNLNQQEKTDLINFLKTLTDYEFINNPDFRP